MQDFVWPCDLCVRVQAVKEQALVCRTEPNLEQDHHHLLLCLEKTTVRTQNSSAITHDSGDKLSDQL